MPLPGGEQLGPGTVERSVEALVGIVGVGPMRATRHRRRVPIVAGTRIILSIIEHLLGNPHAELMAFLEPGSQQSRLRVLEVEERLLAGEQLRQRGMRRRCYRRVDRCPRHRRGQARQVGGQLLGHPDESVVHGQVHDRQGARAQRGAGLL